MRSLAAPAAVCLAVLTTCGPAFGQPDAAKYDEFFETRVRPVLVHRCLDCHGAKKAQSGLRLDSRDAVLRGGDGGPVVVPGKPAESRLVQAVRHAGELKMPEGRKLPAAEVAALERWVELGLPWPQSTTPSKPTEAAKHWAFLPVRKPPPPAVRNPSLARTPIDAFVVAKLDAAGLAPSPAADKRTLIRRATFDLHGLPPTPAEVDAFLADSSPTAYEKLIDRLLASPRYGERWARHWLDVARYADNKGYVFFEQKEYPWAWTYRDYVIGALNRDLPYDRFLLEQLAADHLTLDDPKALAALGFLTVGGHFMNNTHDVIDDRIDVVTRGLMGLTVTCARCHDHKYDPIPAADYYSLYGVFRSCTEPTVPPAWGPEPTTDEHKTFAAELAKKEKAIVDFVTAKHSDLVAGARARAGEYLLAVWNARNQPPADDFMLIADKGDINPAMTLRWRTYLTETKKRPDPVWSPWHAFAEADEKDFPRLATEAHQNARLNRLVRDAFAAPPKDMTDVATRYGKLLADVERRWQVARKAKFPALSRLPDPAAEGLRGVLYGPRSPADAPLALDWGFLSLFPDRATQGEYQKLLKDLEAHVAKGPPRAMALADASPHDPRVFLRGNPNRLGDYVPRQFLGALDPNRKPFTRGSGRLELAKAVASKDNPLTARVFVNRVWMHHFGRGLVATPGDFGTRGDPPTHPELLDWLAADFVEHGWSVKRLHRLVMTSAAYTQSSLDRPDGQRVDPDNRLLWRANRRRLELEALHDAMLAVSDGLDMKEGGPPAELFGGSRRRAVYARVDRLEFPSLWSTFDVPAPSASNPQRVTTTTAPQALFLLNGPFARDCAKRLAAAPAVQTAKEPAAKVEAMFRAAFGRGPADDERAWAVEFAAKAKPERWVDLAHALLMANEFTFID